MMNSLNPTLNLKVKFEVYPGHFVELHPISTLEEKSALEIQAIYPDVENREDIVFNEICRAYGIPENLTEPQKLACILKVREISSGSDCNIKYKCKNCKRISENILLLEDMLDFSLYERAITENPDVLFNLKENIDFGKIHDSGILQVPEFVDLKFNVKTISDYSKVLLILKSGLPKLKPEVTCNCVLCQHEHKVRINRKFILDSLSSCTLSSLYQIYHKLVINGFTKQDVDSMLPFERDVQVTLIDKRIEELRKANSNK